MSRADAPVQLRRQLRVHQTDAERALWSMLRSRQLAGFKFRRQHSVGPYVLDFYCPLAKLAVELDGDHHGEAWQRRQDSARSAFLREQGIRVLRFPNGELRSQRSAVLETILRALVPTLS